MPVHQSGRNDQQRFVHKSRLASGAFVNDPRSIKSNGSLSDFPFQFLVWREQLAR